MNSANLDQMGCGGRAITTVNDVYTAGIRVEETNTEASFISQGRVYRINDRNGKNYQFERKNYQQLGDLPIVGEQYIYNPSLKAENPVSFALIAPKTTDVLRLKPAVRPEELYLNPTGAGSQAVAIRAAYYSAATMIIRQTALDLDINSEEVEIASVHGRGKEGDFNVIGEIMLADYLPNGAGFVEWISRNWAGIVNTITTSDFHNGEQCCDSACYRCLMSYRNRPLHGLLDWRLGRDLMQVFAGAAFDCQQVDINRIALRDRFVRTFSDATSVENTGWKAAFSLDDNLYLIAHPFANARTLHGGLRQTANQWLSAHGNQAHVRLVDSFNLSRRMAWCWDQLEEFPEFSMGETKFPNPAAAVESVFELPEWDAENLITLQRRPRGLPVNLAPVFRRYENENDEVCLVEKYLTRIAENELAVGRISQQGGGYRFVPVNSQHGVEAQNVEIGDIVGVLQ